MTWFKEMTWSDSKPTPHTASTNAMSKQSTEALETRAKIKELLESGKSGKEISKMIGRSETSTYRHIRTLIENGEVDKGKINYNSKEDIDQKWSNIIERTNEERKFYEKQQLIITVRKMGYRLIELAQLARKDKPDISRQELWELGLPDIPDINDPNYEQKKKSFFKGFYNNSAEARRGVTSDYKRETTLPRLPIDCFVDEKRTTIGETDMSYPMDPEPDMPPKDPIKVAKNAIRLCKYDIMCYDGKCRGGIGYSQLPKPNDGLVPSSSVESQGYFRNLGHTSNCHSNLLSDKEYQLAKPIIAGKQ